MKKKLVLVILCMVQFLSGCGTQRMDDIMSTFYLADFSDKSVPTALSQFYDDGTWTYSTENSKEFYDDGYALATWNGSAEIIDASGRFRLTDMSIEIDLTTDGETIYGQVAQVTIDGITWDMNSAGILDIIGVIFGDTECATLYFGDYQSIEFGSPGYLRNLTIDSANEYKDVLEHGGSDPEFYGEEGADVNDIYTPDQNPMIPDTVEPYMLYHGGACVATDFEYAELAFFEAASDALNDYDIYFYCYNYTDHYDREFVYTISGTTETLTEDSEWLFTTDDDGSVYHIESTDLGVITVTMVGGAVSSDLSGTYTW